MRATARLVAGLLTAVWLAGCQLPPRPRRPATPPSAPPAVPRFRDVTAQSGVRFQHVRASSGRKYFVETMGPGVAVLDYDRDGRQDLFFPNGNALPGYRPRAPLLPALYRNLGGRFEETTRQAGL